MGSLSLIVDSDGRLNMDRIKNLSDAKEALEECFHVIFALSLGGDKDAVNAACAKFGYLGVGHDLVGPSNKPRVGR